MPPIPASPFLLFSPDRLTPAQTVLSSGGFQVLLRREGVLLSVGLQKEWSGNGQPFLIAVLGLRFLLQWLTS